MWRPVETTNKGVLVFRISDTEPPPAEDWEFAPGTRVRYDWRDLGGERALVAVVTAESGHAARVWRPPSRRSVSERLRA